MTVFDTFLVMTRKLLRFSFEVAVVLALLFAAKFLATMLNLDATETIAIAALCVAVVGAK